MKNQDLTFGSCDELAADMRLKRKLLSLELGLRLMWHLGFSHKGTTLLEATLLDMRPLFLFGARSVNYRTAEFERLIGESEAQKSKVFTFEHAVVSSEYRRPWHSSP